jgi:hypothetical protein
MAIEGHEHGGRGDHQQKTKEEIDKEIAKLRARMESSCINNVAECKNMMGV